MTQDETDARFVKYLSHFLVSLGCVSVSSRLIPPATEQKFFTSGFVIEVLGDWYFVSAGHVFNEVATYRRSWPNLHHQFVIFSGFGTFAAPANSFASTTASQISAWTGRRGWTSGRSS